MLRVKNLKRNLKMNRLLGEKYYDMLKEQVKNLTWNVQIIDNDTIEKLKLLYSDYQEALGEAKLSGSIYNYRFENLPENSKYINKYNVPESCFWQCPILLAAIQMSLKSYFSVYIHTRSKMSWALNYIYLIFPMYFSQITLRRRKAITTGVCQFGTACYYYPLSETPSFCFCSLKNAPAQSAPTVELEAYNHWGVPNKSFPSPLKFVIDNHFKLKLKSDDI
eukprot:XP_017948990.1 PREDICTED: uncharacterized protein LOC100489253 isoform X1 [Xenopus tropicalis]